MTTILFSMAVLFIVSYIIHDYLKTNKRIKELEKKLVESEEKFKDLEGTEQQLHQEVLNLQNKLKQSFEDPVTHLLGWQVFEDRLNQNLREAERYQLTVGVLFVDINDFKIINDALGYEIGDKVLNEVGKRLEPCIRQVDTLTRFIKDTFVVLLGQLNKPETAAVVAQRMLQALKDPFYIDEHEIFITVSIGVSIYPVDAKNAAELLRNADHAMHLAKEKGQHSYQFYQEKMHIESQRELALNNSLSRDSIFKELIIYYQPIINVKDESIFGMDALLHWQHPQLGLIYPEELFSYAEKQRKLNLITQWLLRSACQQFLNWRALGFTPNLVGVPISVNQLTDTHFIYSISQILQDLEFNPEWLLLEIKERSSQIPFESLEKAFNMLKYIGIKIAIDNFGSDAFSLAYLKNIQANFLKLDPYLVEDIGKNKKTIKLMQAIVNMTQLLSMQVIIPGIESKQQIELLKELGCSLMQGHLLGAPISEREVTSQMSSTISS